MSDKADSKKQSILEAGLECFVETGFSGTSIRAIAKKAGVPVGLIYHYFESKENLWKEVKFYGIKGFFDIDIFDTAPRESLRDFIEYIVSHRFHFYANNESIVRMIHWQTLEDTDEELSGLSKDKLNVWKSILKDYQDKGELRGDVDINLALLFIINSASSLFMSNRKPFGTKDPEKKGAQFLTMLIDVLHDGMRGLTN